MAPDTADTRPARKGPMLRQEKPLRSEGLTGPESVGVVNATRASTRDVRAIMESTLEVKEWRRDNHTRISRVVRVLQTATTWLSSYHASRRVFGRHEPRWLHRRSSGRLRLDRDGSRDRLWCSVQGFRHDADGPQVVGGGPQTTGEWRAELRDADLCLLPHVAPGCRARRDRLE